VRAGGQVLVFALYVLMLIAACLLMVSGSLLVAYVGTDWAEGGGLLSLFGMGCVVVGALLAWAGIVLLRRRRRAVQAPFVESETPEA
jgi:hypothetical protein